MRWSSEEHAFAVKAYFSNRLSGCNSARLAKLFQCTPERPSFRLEIYQNRRIVMMTMKVIVKYLSYWTIGKFKGRSMFTRRTSWGLQDWSSPCLNVLRWSDGPRYSSSSSCRTPGLSERSDPCKNWFPVQNRVSRNYIEKKPHNVWMPQALGFFLNKNQKQKIPGLNPPNMFMPQALRIAHFLEIHAEQPRAEHQKGF